MAVFDVVIAGAGIAGVEGLLRLRRIAGDDVRITVISPATEFVYRPLTVLEPFSPHSLRSYPLAPLTVQTRATHVRDRLQHVDPAFRIVVTQGGREIHYDALLWRSAPASPTPTPTALCSPIAIAARHSLRSSPMWNPVAWPASRSSCPTGRRGRWRSTNSRS